MKRYPCFKFESNQGSILLRFWIVCIIDPSGACDTGRGGETTLICRMSALLTFNEMPFWGYWIVRISLFSRCCTAISVRGTITWHFAQSHVVF